MINRNVNTAILGAVVSVLFFTPELLLAQALEEIIVTAQRREQSLQDVPVSIQTVTGDELSRQGLRTLNDLSMFAPGLVITESAEEQGLLIRGAGTQGKNLAFEQGAPTFIDGIHFGRASSIKSAFMDVDRVEVLRGPQPVYFGQNATAGALNITSRKPGQEWSGSLDGEYGNFGRQSIEAAVGGPVTDTFGIRLAGRYDTLEGYMKDWLTGDDFPMRESKIARVTAQWTPTDSFQASVKYEISDLDFGPRPHALIRDKFPPSTFNLADGESAYLTGIPGLAVPGIQNRPVGLIDSLGVSRQGPFLSPTGYTQANTRDSGGFLDMTGCTPGMLDAPGVIQGPADFQNCRFNEASGAEPWHAVLDLTYEFANGIQVQSLSGFSHQEYFTSRSSGGPFVSNPRYRTENLDQYSSELRFTSPTGGTIEWMLGLYLQDNDLDLTSDVWRQNARRAIRGNRSAEEARWISGFATLTINFADERFSLDLGGRYTEIDKEAWSQNAAATWIVYDPLTDAPFTLPYGRSIGSSDYTHLQNALVIGRTPYYTDRDDFPAGSSVSSRRIGSNYATINENSFDPQIVFRFRPTDNISTYLKYATAFKAGGFDTAVSEVTIEEEDFTFDNESAQIIEAGMRGTFLDGRATGEVTLFFSEFDDLQVSMVDRILDRNVTRNAAKSESKGIEASGRLAVNENLTLSASAVLMNAEIVSFPDGVCTTTEREQDLCDPDNDAIIDRSGNPARNAPDWQFVGNVRYQRPIYGRFNTTYDATFTASDEYITDRAWSRTIRMDSEVDLNLSVSIGALDDVWRLTLYGRNLFEPKPTYFAEDHEIGTGDGGLLFEPLSASNFASYGIKLNYNFL